MEIPITEKHIQQPVNPYGESKLMVERLLHWYGCIHNLHWVALRYFNAAGADPDGELGEDHDPETHIIPNTIKAALGLNPRLVINGNDFQTRDGSCVRDYIHVNDLAQAHIKILDFILEKNKSLSVNLGSGQGSSNLEIVEV